jgi:hypothetical protein
MSIPHCPSRSKLSLQLRDPRNSLYRADFYDDSSSNPQAGGPPYVGPPFNMLAAALHI